MIDWESWLKKWYKVNDEPGKRYSSARQFSLAISSGHNPGAVKEIEDKGITTIERLLEVAQATGLNPTRILLEMGVVTDNEIKAMGLPRVATRDQERALWVVDGLSGHVRQGWLESGEGLLAAQRELA